MINIIQCFERRIFALAAKRLNHGFNYAKLICKSLACRLNYPIFISLVFDTYQVWQKNSDATILYQML